MASIRSTIQNGMDIGDSVNVYRVRFLDGSPDRYDITTDPIVGLLENQYTQILSVGSGVIRAIDGAQCDVDLPGVAELPA